MKEFIKNKKLTQYFLGDPARKVWYTILGFQRNINNIKDRAIVGNLPHETNRLSYFIAYNHHRCRIEYYLINYGYHYTIRKSDIPFEVLQKLNNWEDLSPAVRNGENRFRLIFDQTKKWGVDEQLDKTAGELNLTGGKLSLNFFKVFLTHLIILNKSQLILKGIYDLRMITALKYQDELKAFIINPSSLPRLYDHLSRDSVLNPEGPLRFHIQERFTPDNFVTQLNTLTGTNVNITSIPKAEEALCIQELRRSFQSKSFESNLDLNNRIYIFNTKMLQKYQELIHYR